MGGKQLHCACVRWTDGFSAGNPFTTDVRVLKACLQCQETVRVADTSVTAIRRIMNTADFIYRALHQGKMHRYVLFGLYNFLHKYIAWREYQTILDVPIVVTIFCWIIQRDPVGFIRKFSLGRSTFSKSKLLWSHWFLLYMCPKWPK